MNVNRLEIQLFATGLGFLLLGFAAGANAFAGAEYLRIVSGFDPASQMLAAAFLLAAAAAGAAAVRAVRIEDAFLVAGAALGGAALLAVYFNDLIWHVHAASVESGRGALGRLGLFLLPTGIQTLLVAAAGSAGLGRILGEHADGQARARIAGRFVFALALGSAAGAGAAAVIALLVGLLVLPFLAGCILAGLGLLCWVAHHRLESPPPAGRPDAAADRLLIGAGALGLLVLMGSFAALAAHLCKRLRASADRPDAGNIPDRRGLCLRPAQAASGKERPLPPSSPAGPCCCWGWSCSPACSCRSS